MKTKIQIKTYLGTLLFEYETESNSIRKTLIEAVKQGANLQGAYLQWIKVKKAIILTGLYKYIVIPILAEDGQEYVTMGCYTRSVKEWQEDFWNNTSEFPNDNSIPSQLRKMAFDFAIKWIKINRITN